jgi:transcriptional regulator with XRE-family HTH domain
MTGSALSHAVGMAHNTSGHLETGGRVPRVDTVEKLAHVLHVAPCFLAFGIDQPCESVQGLLSAGLPERLLQARDSRGFSRKELGRRSNTSDGFVRMTEAGATVPNIAKVEQLAQALDVSACWLAYGVGDWELLPRPRSRSAAKSPDPAG